jgi:hypothetical protein
MDCEAEGFGACCEKRAVSNLHRGMGTSDLGAV